MPGSRVLIAVVAIVLLVAAGAIIYQAHQTPPPITTAPPTQQEEKEISLNGMGATFPFPLIDKWIAEYHKIKPKIMVNYQPKGSGAGIRAHMEKTVHFAASDIPLSDDQFRNATCSLHIPITIGGVVIIYNIPGISINLNFTGEVLARIFLGEIVKWNDPSIRAINPGVNLPDKEIYVVHRADASGTTHIFTSYLSAVSQRWKETIGRGLSVRWPTEARFLGARGNDGVAALVQQTPYSIGYVEFTFAKKNRLLYGKLQNAAGEFVEPSIESFMKAAAAAAITLPRGDESWSKVSIIDSIVHNKEAKGAYPMTSFSYIIVYKELSVLPNMDEDAARALVDFLWWCIHDGQKYAADLYYVPLPEEVIRHNEETLKIITFNGRRVYRG